VGANFKFVSGFQYIRWQEGGEWKTVYPGNQADVPAGVTLWAHFKIRNEGSDQKPCAFRMKEAYGSNKCRKEYGWLPPYAWYQNEWEDWCSSFSMPNGDINLVFESCETDGADECGSGFGHDTTATFTLKVQAAPCTQQFIVKDVVSGAVIPGATVHCNGKTCTTGSDGKCGIEVEDGKGYDYYASKSGYEDSSTYHTTFCTGTQTLKLRKIVVKCDQDFKVEDQYGDPVNDSAVMVTDKASGMGIGSCTTGYDGECTAEVDKDVSARACCYAPIGYEIITDSCKDFTTCTTKRTLKLNKIIEPPKFEFVNRTTQGYLFWNGNKCFADETKDVPVGQPISVHAQVKNVGGAAGRAYLQVFKTPLTPVTLCLKNSGSTLIQPGATYTFSEYCFDMDDVNMQIEIDVYALGQAIPDTLGCGEIKEEKNKK